MRQQVIAVALLVYSSVYGQAQVPQSVHASDTLAILEEQEDKKFEARKNLVIGKIKTYAFSKFGHKISVDSIALLDFSYDDTKSDWQSNINEYTYEIWAQVADSYVAKYKVFTKNDSVTKYVTDTKFSVSNDPKLSLMNTQLKAKKAKDDSIVKFMNDSEERKFLTEKKVLEKKIIAYLKSVYKAVSLDSFALSEFTYDDSIPEYWNKITQREYDAWVVYKNSHAAKVKVFSDKGRFVRSELIDQEIESDDRVIMMQDELDQTAEIREYKRFNGNKAGAMMLAAKCLREYANDPNSVKVAKIYFHAANAYGNITYNVVYRAKNGFGAIVIGTQAVTVNGSKCIDVSDVDGE